MGERSVVVSWIGYTSLNSAEVTIKTFSALATLNSLHSRAFPLNIRKQKKEISSQSEDLPFRATSHSHDEVPTLCTHVGVLLKELLALSASSSQPLQPRLPPEMLRVLDGKATQG